ncbi:hypothetical protein ACET3Z_007473 [Daucus carota]
MFLEINRILNRGRKTDLEPFDSTTRRSPLFIYSLLYIHTHLYLSFRLLLTHSINFNTISLSRSLVIYRKMQITD